MTIGARLSLLVSVIAVSLAVMTGLMLTTLYLSDRAAERLAVAGAQREAALVLAEKTSDFSEEIAEGLLFAAESRADYVAARRSVQQAFEAWRELVEQDAASLPPGPMRDRELGELVRINEMRRLQSALELIADQTFQLQAQGFPDRAARLFRDAVDGGLDRQLQGEISTFADNEREEMAEVREAIRRERRAVLVAGLISGLLSVIATVWSGLMLHRAIANPVRLLGEGAAAFRTGDFAHRIRVGGSDELGDLAARFNEMAEQVQSQRDATASAQAGLEAQIAARTAELAESNDRLAELDARRVQFLADISHDLRTPLSALRGEAEVALRIGGEQRPALERIVEQAADMAGFVEDLLFLARSEMDQVRVDRAITYLEPIIEAAMRDTRPMADRKRIELVATPSLDILIDADARRLRQVLVILIDNAITYSRPLDRVEIDADIDADSVTIRVRDTGPGIAEADLPYVFERFWRGAGSVNINPGGSGMGLAIAQWLVQRHQGQIDIRSSGDGTEVTITIPSPGAGRPEAAR